MLHKACFEDTIVDSWDVSTNGGFDLDGWKSAEFMHDHDNAIFLPNKIKPALGNNGLGFF